MKQNLEIIDLRELDKQPSINQPPVLLDLTIKTNVKKEESKPIYIAKPEVKEESKPVEIINTDLNSSFNTGYITEIPSVSLGPAHTEHYLKSECIKEDSMMDTVKPGFGIENILRRECKKPKYKLHLCKENYLGEFEAETEKQLARNNLGVYSQKEVDSLLSRLVESQVKDYVTHALVERMIAELDFVDSTLKAISNYEIPKNLFKL